MAPLSERDNLLYFAKLAEQAERYDDMVDAVKKLARLNVELTEDERNTISVAFRNVAGARREKWRLLSVIEEIEESKGNEANVKRIREYRRKIEAELDDICGDVLTVIDDHLLPFNASVESTVFCNKMKGDFHRYRAELRSGDERKEAANQALKAYELATATAEVGLPPTHFMRLGLALNFSVFYYEVMNSPERACSLARTAYDEALPELDSLSIESYKDSFQMMQLIRDNLILWTADPSGEKESDQVNSSVETRDGCERE